MRAFETIIILMLSVAVIALAYKHMTADYTMSEAQARAYCQPAK